jgi:hypothetical protein
VFFSSFIIKIPKSSKRQSIEKREREREKVLKKRGRKKEKLQESLPNKKGKSIFWEEKNISTSKSFYVSPFSPPPLNHFQNPFQNHLRKFHSSFLDHPLTWKYAWLELYPLSLPMSSTYLAFRGYNEKGIPVEPRWGNTH